MIIQLLTFVLLVFSSAVIAASDAGLLGGNKAYSAPAECYQNRPMSRVCARARSVAIEYNELTVAVTLACNKKLETALQAESELNDRYEVLQTKVGPERKPYFQQHYQPWSEATNQALSEFLSCTTGTRQDLREAGYPRSSVLLEAYITNIEPSVGTDNGLSLATTLQAINDSLDPIATPLQNLSTLLDVIAPHYDMTSCNDTGIRVVSDMLIDAAAGHLIGNAPRALRAMASHSDAALDAGLQAVRRTPRSGWQSPAANARLGDSAAADLFATPGGVFAPDHPLYVPPTLPVPEHLTNSVRTLRMQEQTHSCVQACARMIHETISGKAVPEWWARMNSGVHYTPGQGTQPSGVSRLLDRLGIPNRGWSQLDANDGIDALKKGTENGYPALVNYGSNHATVVDAVVEHLGERYILMRDPTNPALLPDNVRTFQQNLGFEHFNILREADFLPSFEKGQRVVLFTDPALFK